MARRRVPAARNSCHDLSIHGTGPKPRDADASHPPKGDRGEPGLKSESAATNVGTVPRRGPGTLRRRGKNSCLDLSIQGTGIGTGRRLRRREDGRLPLTSALSFRAVPLGLSLVGAGVGYPVQFHPHHHELADGHRGRPVSDGVVIGTGTGMCLRSHANYLLRRANPGWPLLCTVPDRDFASRDRCAGFHGI